jgi:hypothetical protein
MRDGIGMTVTVKALGEVTIRHQPSNVLPYSLALSDPA